MHSQADDVLKRLNRMFLAEDGQQSVSTRPIAKGFEWDETFGSTEFTFRLTYESLGRRPEEAASVKLVVLYKDDPFAEFYYRVGRGPKAITVLGLAQARSVLSDLRGMAGGRGAEAIGLDGEFYPVSTAQELLSGLRSFNRGKPYSGSLVTWPSDLVDSGLIKFRSPQGQSAQPLNQGG